MTNEEIRAKNWGGGNAGLMGREENMKPFPSLPTVLGNPANNAGFPHYHRTATTIEFGQFYFVAVETNQLCSNRKCSRSLEMVLADIW